VPRAHVQPETTQAYAARVRRFVLHHGRRRPAELDGDDVAAYLSHLANDADVSASTQSQAASALLFLTARCWISRLSCPT
jgi:hypothetical protein